MYQIIFSDIDGTLLNSRQEISDAVKIKIQELDRRGIPFVLASSRLSGGVFPIMAELGIHAPAISYSGALVHDKSGNVVMSLEIPVKTAREIHDFVVKTDESICCCTYSHDLWLADDKSSPWLVREEEITGLEASEGDISDFEEYTGVHKLLCMGGKENIDALAENLRVEFADMYICRSKDTYLEINHPSVSKANAMRFVCDYLGISVKDAIAFGDGEVDLEMLRLAGKGFAMANSAQSVKTGAKYITASNDDDGVLKAIISLGL